MSHDPTPSIEQAGAVQPGGYVYVRLIRPEGYEDVHPELLLEDARINPAFQPEVVATPQAAPAAPSTGWMPIETAPKDGSMFVVARFVEGETSDPDFDYELGRYKPLIFDRYEAVADDLFRKVPEQVYDWQGFNNFGRMTHWMALPPPPKEHP